MKGLTVLWMCLCCLRPEDVAKVLPQSGQAWARAPTCCERMCRCRLLGSVNTCGETEAMGTCPPHAWSLGVGESPPRQRQVHTAQYLHAVFTFEALAAVVGHLVPDEVGLPVEGFGALVTLVLSLLGVDDHVLLQAVPEQEGHRRPAARLDPGQVGGPCPWLPLEVTGIQRLSRGLRERG